jgi:hypothetical protein
VHATEGVHVEWVEDEAVILHPETKQLHYLNSSAAMVYALIQEEGFDAALKEIRARHQGPEVEENLRQLVEDLVEKGLLVDG